MGDYRTVITVNLKMRYDRQAYKKAYYAEHREERKAYKKAYRVEHLEESKAYDKAYYAEHREESKAYHVVYYAEPKNRIKKLVSGAKQRRRGEVESGLYEALIANIPTLCPVCDGEIDWGVGRGQRRSCPSLDRRNNDLGYTIANTYLICFGCNRLKSDASPAKIQRLALYMETQA